jgi:hypothetical protein
MVQPQNFSRFPHRQSLGWHRVPPAWRTTLPVISSPTSAQETPPQGRPGSIGIAVRIPSEFALYRQISPTPPRAPIPTRALPSIVVENLYRLFDPESPESPFRTPALRWRNLLIFLRRGEVAILAADAVKDDFDPVSGCR